MTGRSRLLVLLASFVVAGLLGPLAAADTIGLPPGSQIRLAGDNRYETAVEVSKATFAPPTDLVFIATGQDFPDALAAGPAAGHGPEAPILLVRQDSVPASVAGELRRLKPDTIAVLGGPSVVSDSVLTQLDGLAGSGGAFRVSGANRYQTAAQVARTFFEPSETRAALLATGRNYPDALSGGPVGGLTGAPILLARESGVPDVTLTAMQDLDITTVVFLGGTALLPDSLKNQITDAIGPVNFPRFAGANRYETSAEIATATFDRWETDVAYLAVGTNFPDALAGAPSAAVNKAPILLSRQDCMPTATHDALEQLDVSKVVLLGGPGTLSSAAPTTECPQHTRGTVSKVIDGDTIDVQGQGRVRLIGIDTPERGECGYDEATANMERLVLGKTVTLVPGARDDTDRYDRLLRYVDVGSTDAGLDQIERGLAIARYDSRDGYGKHPREEQYIAADNAAPNITCSAPPPGADCDPAYPTVCIPPPPPDLDCGQITERNFTVLAPDPHRFDGDRDGVGCES